MAKRLRKLKITRVAVCDQGANPDADILLFKSMDAVAKEDDTDDACTCDDEGKKDCPIHGVQKEDGVTVGEVSSDTAAGTCNDADCDDKDCPVHGSGRRRRKKPVEKGPIGEMGMHAEPDGDEEPPLDYATRGQQYDLWEQLWQKWQCLTTTFQDVCGDWDADNVPHLPILERSIGQFHDDVAQLLEDCGVMAKAAPLLAELTEVSKAGAAMAGHRRKRLQDAIAALQQLLEECTPDELPHGILPDIDRAGVSAAQVAGFPAMMKGETLMTATPATTATTATTATMSPMVTQSDYDAMAKRATDAEARVKELEPLAAQVAGLETTIAKMRQTPEEQEAEYWAGVPETVRKKHEADEAEKVELRKQLDDARQEREQTVYITKTADFRGFGMVSKHWRILKAIDGIADQEDREELLRLMKASAERDQTSEIYKAHGSDGRYGPNGTVENASADDQLYALTLAYMEEKGVDFLPASAVIAKQHRDLYKRATEERREAATVRSR